MQRQWSKYFRKTWVVVLVCAIAFLVFAQAMKSRRTAIAQLQLRIAELETIRLLACRENEELNQQIQSQNDPAWIELVLLREVGVVPEGFLKVHFKK